MKLIRHVEVSVKMKFWYTIKVVSQMLSYWHNEILLLL